MTASKIEWTDRSDWNPVRGCSRVSPGCGGPGPHGGCYAEAMAARFSKPGMWGHGFAEMKDGRPRWTGKVELQEDRLLMPLSWRRPGLVFPNSTSDFFHENLSDRDITRLFAVMACCPHLTFQIPTKRAARMRDFCATMPADLSTEVLMIARQDKHGYPVAGPCVWPIPNVWLGVSAERQEEADERIPHLLQTPAAIRFVSAEPLLGPLDIQHWLQPARGCANCGDGQQDGKCCDEPMIVDSNALDWVIIGGESGPLAREHDLEWSRGLIAQCKSAGVAVFEKQLGSAPFSARDKISYRGRKGKFPSGGFWRHLNSSKGGDWSEWPEDLRVREFPKSPALQTAEKAA